MLSLTLGTGLALLFQRYFVRQYVSQVLVKQQFSEARHIAEHLDAELGTEFVLRLPIAS